MSNEPSTPVTRLQVGDRVRVNMVAYREWWEVDNGIPRLWLADEGGENMQIMSMDDGQAVVQGNGWGGGVPIEFLERLP